MSCSVERYPAPLLCVSFENPSNKSECACQALSTAAHHMVPPLLCYLLSTHKKLLHAARTSCSTTFRGRNPCGFFRGEASTHSTLPMRRFTRGIGSPSGLVWNGFRTSHSNPRQQATTAGHPRPTAGRQRRTGIGREERETRPERGRKEGRGRTGGARIRGGGDSQNPWLWWPMPWRGRPREVVVQARTKKLGEMETAGAPAEDHQRTEPRLSPGHAQTVNGYGDGEDGE